MNFPSPKFALFLAAIATVSAAEPKIYQVQELDQAPKATIQTKPRYPSDVTQDHTGATVEVAFVIESSGRVVGARVRDCKVDTLHNSVDFDASAHGTDSKTHESATAESDYSTLLNAANQFANSATQAVGKWKFSPGLKDGKPVDSAMAVTIEYVHKFAIHGDTSEDPIARVGAQSSDDKGARSFSSDSAYVITPSVPARYLVSYPKL